jgi:predicted dehydrogenase
MDCIQRRYSRRCKIVGEKGTITWDYSKNQVQIYCAENKREELFSYVFDANDMYTAELEHFLDCVLHDHPPIVGLRQAGLVVQVALEAMEQAVSKEFAPKI